MANSMAVIPDNEIIVEGGGLVPSTQGASSGDVLTVGQNGPEWAAPGGGGGGGVPDVADPLYVDTDDAVSLRYGSGLYLEDGENYNDTLAVALSGTGGLYYDEMEDNGLAVQLDPAGGLENVIDDGVQVGLKVKTDGTTIDINASGELEAIGGGGGDLFVATYQSTTFSEIETAVNAGKTVVLKYSGAGATYALLSRLDSFHTTAYFTTIDSPTQSNADDTIRFTCFYVVNNYWYSYNVLSVPSHTSSDEGKVLSVNSTGTTAWATPVGGMTQLLTPAQTASLIEVRGLPNNVQWTAGYYGDPMATFTRGNGVRRLFICVELDSADFSYSVIYYNMSVGLKLRNSGSDVAPLSLAHIKDEIYQVNPSENTMIICKEIPLYIPGAFNHNGTVVSVDDVAITSVSIDFDSTGAQPSSLAASSLSVWVI